MRDQDGSEGRVRSLPDATVARIAAGEVVTRPASAVAELVENALDAGASSVSVALTDAGRSEIRVRDDGHGMAPADARRAVERHTTSKLSDDDVSAVETLGFRGEALASLADAGTLELTTRRGGHDATRVTLPEGPDGPVESAPASHPEGTTVVVRDLFADWPARRESLATNATEFARASDVVSRYALVRPDVRFRFTHDDATVFSTSGSGDYTDALLSVYDREVAGQARPVAYETGGADDGQDDGTVGVAGAVVSPAVTRASSSHVHVAVNGRALRDETLRRAVGRGYGSLLPGDRSPVAVVDVSVSPDRVDVNVHPAKEEVALRDEATVTEAVETAVADALATDDLDRAGDLAFDLDAALDGTSGDSVLADVAVIGTFRDLYVLCEADDELLVVDQHAAHERINYERLLDALGDGVDSVPVDPPATQSLTPDAMGVLDDARETLAALGYEVASFGGTTVRVEAVPAPMGRALPPDSLVDTLDELADGDLRDPREAICAELACHPSLKAGDALTEEDAARLVERLGACDQPFACPHGRPTVVSVEEADLARGFDRHGTRFG